MFHYHTISPPPHYFSKHYQWWRIRWECNLVFPRRPSSVWVRDGIITLWACVSFIQHESPQMICNPYVLLLVDVTLELALETSNELCSPRHLKRIGQKPVGVQVFMLNIWEVRLYVIIYSLSFNMDCEMERKCVWIPPLHTNSRNTIRPLLDNGSISNHLQFLLKIN